MKPPASPRHVEPATGAPNYGRHIAAVGAALGTPFLPWQKYVATVATEVDRAGRFRHGIVIVTVPRQAGKTTLSMANNIRRAMSHPQQRIWYTAQTGQHAASKWAENVEVFEKSALARLARSRWSRGSESQTFWNGSVIRPHPPTPEALHSKQSDLNVIDEAWAFDEVEGNALMQQIVPTYTTRETLTGLRPQLWILSTEGTAESTFFNQLLARARAGDPAIALFDWGIDTDVDVNDLDAVAARHPGYGHLFGMRELREFKAQLSDGEFARAYGNRRTGGALDRIIAPAAWTASATVEPIPDDAPIAVGAAVGIDGTDAAIVAAGTRADGTIIVEVIEYRPGWQWLADRLDEISVTHSVEPAIDRVGTGSAVESDLYARGVPLTTITTSAVTSASARVVSGINADPPTWLHRPHPALDAAAENATRRLIGDGGFGFSRRKSVGSIACLEAAALATHALAVAPPPAPAPLIIGG